MASDVTSIIDRLRAVEDEIRQLDEAIAKYRPRPKIQISSAQLRERVRRGVLQLQDMLRDDDAEKARTAFRDTSNSLF